MKPAPNDDYLDSELSMEIAAPYYDEDLHAWVLSRYADVLAAFRAPGLVPAGAKVKKVPASGDGDSGDDGPRLRMRAETLDALSPQQLRDWSAELSPIAHDHVCTLPIDRAVDLVTEFAQPLCLRLAVMVTGVDPDDAEELRRIAQPVSEAAAEPYDPVMSAQAAKANLLLRGYFRVGPEPLRDSGFVALSHTVPCLLANCWFALLQHPESWRRLHCAPDLMGQAVEEMLRYAGLTRTLFRRATEDVDINGLRIPAEDRLVLRILAANRDPERFPQPDQFDLACPQSGQLSLGAGPHACVGASLIRMAMIAITRPLLERFSSAHLAGAVEWKGGSSFRSPAALHVLLEEELRLSGEK
jgi:cytochrome P450